MEQTALKEFVDGVVPMMGEKLEQIILYGSVARGTSTEESDVDIALLIHGTIDENLEDHLLDFIVDMNLKYNRVFSVIDIDYETFRKWENVLPFYSNVRREGVTLWKAA
ncbi:nucleotidyltransferase domain-containing protein [Eubacteriaceae bacterium Marseille-Q4139]|jgi:uncharacterized protein|nr:nucleotidyltransferase domain-containing protein [Eubacteriaceae bacterium Marseille-Q4139]